MIEDPLVTLGLTVWSPRRVDWLRTAVDSALAQRGCRIELLVVDDGSPQPVEELLAGVDDERMHILRLPHGGLPIARNAVFEHGAGDYVRLLDDDDAFPVDGTALLLRAAEGRQDRITYGITMVCDPELCPRWRMAPRQHGDATVDSLLARFNVRPGGMLFPRRVFELAGGFDPSFGVSEDWDFIQRALEHAEVRRVPAVVHLYRRHGGGMTTDYAAGEVNARRVVDRYFERHPEQRGTRLQARAYAMLDARQARIRALRGDRTAAMRHAASALRRDPFAFANELHQAASALRGRLATRLGRTP